jgi:hypothetical protein
MMVITFGLTASAVGENQKQYDSSVFIIEDISFVYLRTVYEIIVRLTDIHF